MKNITCRILVPPPLELRRKMEEEKGKKEKKVQGS
jgi:hypothetical protein